MWFVCVCFTVFSVNCAFAVWDGIVCVCVSVCVLVCLWMFQKRGIAISIVLSSERLVAAKGVLGENALKRNSLAYLLCCGDVRGVVTALLLRLCNGVEERLDVQGAVRAAAATVIEDVLGSRGKRCATRAQGNIEAAADAELGVSAADGVEEAGALLRKGEAYGLVETDAAEGGAMDDEYTENTRAER